ncbi:uncharacterized protein LOC119151095 isoform X4 [Falco rusticolus]|uniref:uncharacterized protein LOC119151095 isoform X4 n=1 Tax=Falco rusticolus TaxID=120794 RepID=UPI001886A379|nr:uncharacterized protein LOC119151095 isoform X4 [Falco rusticolus]XP_037250417.1 uncharacterized protein LOC119151095 isoform X4 [Falco rusticolus]
MALGFWQKKLFSRHRSRTYDCSGTGEFPVHQRGIRTCACRQETDKRREGTLAVLKGKPCADRCLLGMYFTAPSRLRALWLLPQSHYFAEERCALRLHTASSPAARSRLAVPGDRPLPDPSLAEIWMRSARNMGLPFFSIAEGSVGVLEIGGYTLATRISLKLSLPEGAVLC